MKRRAAFVAMLACAASGTAVWAALKYLETRDEIPVVRTYGDLLRLEPIELEGGVKVWVGKEASSCPVGCGVLVYVLAEGVYEHETHMDDQAEPIWIRSRRAQEPPTGIRWFDAADRVDGSTAWLYTRRIDVTEHGTLQIEALTLKGKVLRTSQVRGESAEFHGFLPWDRWYDILGPDGLAVGAALPEGPELPLQKIDVAAEVPHLLPAEPSPGFTIAQVDHEIRIQSSVDLLAEDARPFMARFWVNGAPFIPKYSWSEAPRGGRPFQGTTVNLSFGVNPSALGARKGDRLALQVLFCPDGGSSVDYLFGRLARLRLAAPYTGPLLSNKIEFIAE